MQLQEHFNLKDLNTFGIEAKAKYFAEIREKKDLRDLISSGILTSESWLILGEGSNILFRGDYDGLILKTRLSGMTTEKCSEDQILVTAAAGESWHGLVMRCMDHNWGGIENLALIPGTVGAAPVQNIGAYGRELSEVLEYVDVIDLETGDEDRLDQKVCAFGYRDSLFKQPKGKKFFISSVTLRLTTKNHLINTSYGAISTVLMGQGVEQPTLQDVGRAVISIRKEKLPDPQKIGNAGSFFKNPVVDAALIESIQNQYSTLPFYKTENQQFKIPAAWLIETAGWKGKRLGNTGVHEKQALVLVNYGGATGEEILNLSQQIMDDVKTKFGVQLQREVQIAEGKSPK
ncbi:MAG: UDP-N-acetylmuramate dehydrogenase [Bacteroidetes bacterium]|nr:UDP-N-acetylmuramate dehydrogenase [Bacteroidota bacterium]